VPIVREPKAGIQFLVVDIETLTGSNFEALWDFD
jgi:hypothetical protein